MTLKFINELFFIKGKKVGIKIPMMHTKGKFKVYESESYTAVALPLDSEYINVRQYFYNKNAK